MKKMNLWIDTDMGNDDIMAIAMLSQDPSIDINAISLVNGVSHVKKGLPNLKGILEYLKIDPHIFEDTSITQYPYELEFPKQDINRAEELTLLDKLPIKPIVSQSSDISELLSLLPDQSVLLALGPLTNIANMIKHSPDLFRKKITQVVLMGGGIEKGNVPPNRLAEYNIALDPQSAEKVFNCGIPITMIGIDATAFVPASNEFKNIIKKTKPVNKTAQILKLIIMNNETDFDQFYDPLAAAWFFNKEIFNSTLRGNINVPSTGKESGKTILNINSKGNVNIPLEANAKLFYDLIQKLIEKSQLSNRN